MGKIELKVQSTWLSANYLCISAGCISSSLDFASNLNARNGALKLPYVGVARSMSIVSW